MAKKKKRNQVSQAQQLAIAQRELEKGNTKQALKHAKSCYRLDPSPAVRALLQQSLLMRGRELHARAMHEPARALVVELDELGEVAAEYQADATRLKALLGLVGNLDSPEILADKGLRDELADQAVLQGPSSSTTMARTAEAVRAALASAETGDYERAVELVADISRDSPFCDWKLLVRGLCAYYSKDDSRRIANWSRLAPDRPARQIADTLWLLTDLKRYSEAPGAVLASFHRLTRALTPSLADLRQLQRKLQDSECTWSELRSELRRFMNAHAKTEPAIAQRVAKIIVQRAVKLKEPDALVALQRILPPLSLDPKLNRVSALLSEDLGDLSQTGRLWEAYIDDLPSCEAFNDFQKATAQALIYNRLAAHHVAAIEKEEDFPKFFREDEALIDELERDAIRYFRKSLDANANLPSVHLAFGQFLHQRGKDKDAAVTFRALGRRFPDDAEAQLAAAGHFVSNNQPGVAKEYAKRARGLRPRDSQSLTLVWKACLGTARQAAKQRMFGLAEAELAEAESLLSEAGHLEPFILQAIRAAVALKQGQLRLRRDISRRRSNRLSSPPPHCYWSTRKPAAVTFPLVSPKHWEFVSPRHSKDVRTPKLPVSWRNISMPLSSMRFNTAVCPRTSNRSRPI